MLRLLTATDFSENAQSAMRVALRLARSYSAEVFFLHAMARPPVPAISPEEVYNSIYQAEQQELEQRLQEECRQLYMELGLRPKEVMKHVYILPTPVTDTILQIISRDKIDLLIMGSSGASGVSKLLLGSNTNEMMRNTPIPLLVVPPKFAFNGFKEISVVIRLKRIGNRPGLPLVQKLANTYSATVHALVVLDEEDEAQSSIPLKEAENLLQGLNYKIHTIRKDSKAKELENHLQKTKTDLVVWLPMPSGLWNDSLTESFTEEVASEAGIPLLVIPHIEQEP